VEQTVTAPGNLVNVGQSDVKMSATGKLSGVNVRVGDTVKAGQTLAELDPVTITQAQVNLLEAQEELEKLQRNRTAMDYPRATDSFIKEYKQKIKTQKMLVGQLAAIYENAIGPEEKAAALTMLSNAQTKLTEMENNLKWYQGRPTDADKAAANAELALAQAKYDAAKAVLDSLKVIAPIDGIVLAVNAESGQTYQAETSLFTIGDPKSLEVIAKVTEEDYPLLIVGQSVEIYFDARPDVVVIGKVERIIPKRIEGDRPLYHVYITLKDIPDGLADGMTADTAITIAKREGVLCLPRAVVRASGGDTTIAKVWDGVQVVEKEIKVGLRGDAYVEILEGLSEGDQVVAR
jgi:RND family efflux transporter MFP subunit